MRSTRKKRRSKNTVVRSKADYPTRRRAMRSLEDEGIFAHMLTARHSGTFWMWEVSHPNREASAKSHSWFKELSRNPRKHALSELAKQGEGRT